MGARRRLEELMPKVKHAMDALEDQHTRLASTAPGIERKKQETIMGNMIEEFTQIFLLDSQLRDTAIAIRNSQDTERAIGLKAGVDTSVLDTIGVPRQAFTRETPPVNQRVLLVNPTTGEKKVQ